MEVGRSAFRNVKSQMQDGDLLIGVGDDERTISEWIFRKLLSVRGIVLMRLGIGIFGKFYFYSKCHL